MEMISTYVLAEAILCMQASKRYRATHLTSPSAGASTLYATLPCAGRPYNTGLSAGPPAFVLDIDGEPPW